ncbi:hypothetical protein GCM10011416_17350 [Polaribacter pacificus]|uniref:Methyltransferase domain-containing protein n=1 Tax=Polaribacter pacificus TaxID=1775173 RepID=A0A917I148_9FLAO|nr:hypothetical protein [Polaribacter pacificus]GGG99540.1 hypothetical protein GCM10011416_17350 [Polaribacter pacificus]
MTVKQLSKIYYKHFSKLNGNEHIASVYGIEVILNLIAKYKPKNILELGLGIGSISYSIIDFLSTSNKDYNYYGTENNEFCLQVLPTNLKEKYDKINLFNEFKNIPTNLKFDFIIIDGSDKSLAQIKKSVSNRAIIFIEGYRIDQVNFIKSIFPKSIYTSVISDFKNPKHGPFDSDKWSGGGQLIFVNPSFQQKMHRFYLRLLTSFKYKITRKLR